MEKSTGRGRCIHCARGLSVMLVNGSATVGVASATAVEKDPLSDTVIL